MNKQKERKGLIYGSGTIHELMAPTAAMERYEKIYGDFFFYLSFCNGLQKQRILMDPRSN